jgi:hypothetical protein
VTSSAFGRDSHISTPEISIKSGVSPVVGIGSASVEEVTDRSDRLMTPSDVPANVLPAVFLSGGVATDVSHGFSTPVDSFDSTVHGETPVSTLSLSAISTKVILESSEKGETSSFTLNSDSSQSSILDDEDLVASLMDGIWVGCETSCPTRSPSVA